MNWVERNKNKIIRSSFLLPILLVVVISISHVVNWYEIGNPINWAIYLSIAIEIFALTSVSAATININKGTIWFLFILVTLIQMIGNVFFSYNHINETGEIFKTWVELIGPLFEDWDTLAHKRFLALIQGGTLPIMSLTALHFYLKFNEDEVKKVNVEKKTELDLVGTESNVTDSTENVVTGTTNTIELTDEKINALTVLKDGDVEIKENGYKLVTDVEPELGDVNITQVDLEEPYIPKESEDGITDMEEKKIKREDIKEVKLRDNNGITRVGTNKYQSGNTSGIIYDNGGRNRNR